MVKLPKINELVLVSIRSQILVIIKMSGLLNFVKPSYYKNLFNGYVRWWGECTEKGKNTHIWTFLAFTSASNYWLFAYPKLKGE